MAESEAFSPERVGAALGEVRRRIEAAGGDPKAVTVVAVTKGLPVDAAHAAVAAGLFDLGENYAAELLAKAAALAGSGPARWHLIGGIQRRTVARLAPFVFLYQSVDRIEEGRALVAHAPGAAALVEVDTTGMPGRAGVAPEDTEALVEGLLGLGLSVEGLMTVAPKDDPAGAHLAFRTVRGLVERLGLAVCSMGMSDDLEIAVAEGSTMVRVGRALFGPRQAKTSVPQLDLPGQGA